MDRRAGARMRADMAEQADWLGSVDSRRDELSRAIPPGWPDPGRRLWTLGRGSSAHAASMALPQLSRASGSPVGALRIDSVLAAAAVLPAPGDIVVALSQSGRTLDVARAAERLSAAGCHVIALVNERGVLADHAAAVVELGVGPERAVPATKSVLAQVTLLWMLGEALGRQRAADELTGTACAQAVTDALEHPGPVERAVEQLATAPPVAGTGRASTAGLAAEWAHKTMETSGLPIFAASAPEFAHGPVAIAAPGRSVVGFAATPETRRTVRDVLDRAAARGAVTVLVAAGGDVPVPDGPVTGLLAGLVRAQLLTERLAVARGSDPDTAFGLSKVTATN